MQDQYVYNTGEEEPSESEIAISHHEDQKPLFAGFDEAEEANNERERNTGTPLAPAVIATEDALMDGDPSDTPFVSPITPSLPNTPGPFGH